MHSLLQEVNNSECSFFILFTGMMDKVLGGTMGVLKQEVTMVTEVIDKLKGRALPQNSLSLNLGSDSNLKNGGFLQSTDTFVLNNSMHFSLFSQD